MQTSQLLMLGVRQLPACTFACASSCNPESLRNLTGAQRLTTLCPPLSREGFCSCQNRGENWQKSCSMTMLTEQALGDAGDYMGAGCAQQCQRAI